MAPSTPSLGLVVLATACAAPFEVVPPGRDTAEVPVEEVGSPEEWPDEDPSAAVFDPWSIHVVRLDRSTPGCWGEDSTSTPGWPT